MHCLCWGLAWGASFVGSTPATEWTPLIDVTPVAPSQAEEAEATIYTGSIMKLAVPTNPLAKGSVTLLPRQINGVSDQPFSAWQPFQRAEAYALMQRVARVWESQGITDYMIFGKEAQSETPALGALKSHLEMVPFPKNQWNTWQQFKVLWKITMGAGLLSQVERQQEALEMRSALFLEDAPSADSELFKALNIENEPFVKGKDAFCNPEVISKQLIFEGKEVNLLYNYKPIEKLHFLITPKRHHVRFSDLTESEYMEATQITQKLMRFYQEQGYPIVYFFNKTGVMQTVPHWHEHVIFTASKTDAVWGELKVLKKMLLPSWPLSSEEVKNRVHVLRAQLKEVLEHP